MTKGEQLEWIGHLSEGDSYIRLVANTHYGQYEIFGDNVTASLYFADVGIVNSNMDNPIERLKREAQKHYDATYANAIDDGELAPLPNIPPRPFLVEYADHVGCVADVFIPIGDFKFAQDFAKPNTDQPSVAALQSLPEPNAHDIIVWRWFMLHRDTIETALKDKVTT